MDSFKEVNGYLFANLSIAENGTLFEIHGDVCEGNFVENGVLQIEKLGHSFIPASDSLLYKVATSNRPNTYVALSGEKIFLQALSAIVPGEQLYYDSQQAIVQIHNISKKRKKTSTYLKAKRSLFNDEAECEDTASEDESEGEPNEADIAFINDSQQNEGIHSMYTQHMDASDITLYINRLKEHYNVGECVGLCYNIARTYHIMSGSEGEDELSLLAEVADIRFPPKSIMKEFGSHDAYKPNTSTSLQDAEFMVKKSKDIVLKYPSPHELASCIRALVGSIPYLYTLKPSYADRRLNSDLDQTILDIEEERAISGVTSHRPTYTTEDLRDSEERSDYSQVECHNDALVTHVKAFMLKSLQSIKRRYEEGADSLQEGEQIAINGFKELYLAHIQEKFPLDSLTAEENLFVVTTMQAQQTGVLQYIQSLNVNVHQETLAIDTVSPWKTSDAYTLHAAYDEMKEHLTDLEAKLRSDLLSAVASDSTNTSDFLLSLLRDFQKHVKSFLAATTGLADTFDYNIRKQACKFAVNRIHVFVCERILIDNSSAPSQPPTDDNHINFLIQTNDKRKGFLPLPFRDDLDNLPTSCASGFTTNVFVEVIFARPSIVKWMAKYSLFNEHLEHEFDNSKNTRHPMPMSCIGLQAEFSIKQPTVWRSVEVQHCLVIVFKFKRRVTVDRVVKELQRFNKVHDILMKTAFLLPIPPEKGHWAYGVVYTMATDKAHKVIGGSVDGAFLAKAGVQIMDEGLSAADTDALLSHFLKLALKENLSVLQEMKRILEESLKDDSMESSLSTAVRSAYTNPITLMRTAKSIVEYVNEHVHQKPSAYQDNRVKVAFAMLQMLFRDLKTSTPSPEMHDETRHGSRLFRLTAASPQIMKLLSKYRQAPITIISILRSAGINPEFFFNAVMDQLIVDKDRGRVLILHSVNKMTGKSTIGKCLEKLLEGRRINVDIKKNIDAKFESIDTGTCGLAIVEDISKEGMHVINNKLKSLVDGHKFVCDRKWERIGKQVRWPSCLITTNMSRDEIEGKDIFEKRAMTIEFGLSLDDPSLNFEATRHMPDESEMISFFWKYSFFPHCSLMYDGLPSAFSPCTGAARNKHHLLCPYMNVLDSYVAMPVTTSKATLSDGVKSYNLPCFDRVRKSHLLFFLDSQVLRDVFQMFLYDYVRDGKAICEPSEAQQKKEQEVSNFFDYVVQPLAKCFNEVYAKDFVFMDSSAYRLDCPPNLDPFNVDLFDAIVLQLRGTLQPGEPDSNALLFMSPSTPTAKAYVDGLIDREQFEGRRLRKWRKFISDAHKESCGRKNEAVPNYDLDSCFLILNGFYRTKLDKLHRQLPTHCLA
jgi:hypothetical protein